MARGSLQTGLSMQADMDTTKRDRAQPGAVRKTAYSTDVYCGYAKQADAEITSLITRNSTAGAQARSATLAAKPAPAQGAAL
ncbi:hypothetical protein AB4Z48_37825 [Cupriavidus sp. 2TAF22]|uniref:hypothetical protein n=1 Tax=unclassified Cupriavidus TaxID=2640874 RepID=UPI003F8FFFD5